MFYAKVNYKKQEANNEQTMNLLMNRKSVRVFEDKEITQDIKDQILVASNEKFPQPEIPLYSIIDVTDQSIKDKLAVTCDNQLFIADAKWCLLCQIITRWYKKFKQATRRRKCSLSRSSVGLILATNDAVIAAHTACIAAESLNRAPAISAISWNSGRHTEISSNLPL